MINRNSGLAALLSVATCAGFVCPVGAYAASDVVEKDGFTIKNGKLTSVKGLSGEIVIPDEVKEIQKGVFKDCDKVTKVTTSKRMKTIESNSFKELKNLKEIVITNGAKTIKANSFSYLKSLEKVTMTSSVDEIQESAFEGCKNLSDVEITNGTDSNAPQIYANAFKGTKWLEDIRDNDGFSVFNGVLISAECEGNVTIPSNVKTIAASAFYGCDKLKSVKMQKSVETIES